MQGVPYREGRVRIMGAQIQIYLAKGGQATSLAGNTPDNGTSPGLNCDPVCL